MRSRNNKTGLGRIAIYIAILAISAGIIIRIFYALYDVSRQNIIGIWRNKTREMAQEFLDYKGRWMRIRFIAVEHDEKGRLSQVLFAFESIDEDRKRQEGSYVTFK